MADQYKNVNWVIAADASDFIPVASLLKGKPVRVIIRPGINRMPNTRERVNVAKLLHENNVEFMFTSSAEGPLNTPDMPLFAVAMVVNNGVPRSVAIEALTARPAALLGLEKTHGSLEVGKSASILVFDGDPLSAESRLRKVFVEGVLVHEN
jgi:imidazolonepropionase-like amidohydrolase